jgi:S1-C subfamily serine protease
MQGKVAGVAFSKLSQADNVGYIIPWKIVAHFMREYEEHGSKLIHFSHFRS